MSFDAAKWRQFESEIASLEQASVQGSSDYFVAIQAKDATGAILDVKCLSNHLIPRLFQRLAIWLKSPKETQLIYARARSDNVANRVVLAKLSHQIDTELRLCALDEPHLLELMKQRQVRSLEDLLGPRSQKKRSPEESSASPLQVSSRPHSPVSKGSSQEEEEARASSRSSSPSQESATSARFPPRVETLFDSEPDECQGPVLWSLSSKQTESEVQTKAQEAAALMRAVCTRVNRLLQSAIVAKQDTAALDIKVTGKKRPDELPQSMPELALYLVDVDRVLTASRMPVKREKYLIWKANFQMTWLETKWLQIEQMEDGLAKAKQMLELLEKMIEDASLLEILSFTKFKAFNEQLRQGRFFEKLARMLEGEARATRIDPKKIELFCEVEREFQKLMEREADLKGLSLEQREIIKQVAASLKEKGTQALDRAHHTQIELSVKRIHEALEAKKRALEQQGSEQSQLQGERAKALEAFKEHNRRLTQELKQLEVIFRACEAWGYIRADSRLGRAMSDLARKLAEYKRVHIQVPQGQQDLLFCNLFEDAKWLTQLRELVKVHGDHLMTQEVGSEERVVIDEKLRCALEKEVLERRGRALEHTLLEVQKNLQELTQKVVVPKRSAFLVGAIREFLQVCAKGLSQQSVSRLAQEALEKFARGEGERVSPGMSASFLRSVIDLLEGDSASLDDRVVALGALYELLQKLGLGTEAELQTLKQAQDSLKERKASLFRYVALSGVDAHLMSMEYAYQAQDHELAANIRQSLSEYMRVSKHQFASVSKLLACENFCSKEAYEAYLEVKSEFAQAEEQREDSSLQATSELAEAQAVIQRLQLRDQLSKNYAERVQSALYFRFCERIESVLPPDRLGDRNYAAWSQETWMQVMADLSTSAFKTLKPVVERLLLRKRRCEMGRQLIQEVEAWLPEALRGDRKYMEWSRAQWGQVVESTSGQARHELIQIVERSFKERSELVPYRRVCVEIEKILPSEYWGHRDYEKWSQDKWQSILKKLELKEAGLLQQLVSWVSQKSVAGELKELLVQLPGEAARSDVYYRLCRDIEAILPEGRWGDRNYLTWSKRKFEMALEGLDLALQEQLFPLVKHLREHTFMPLPFDFALADQQVVRVRSLRQKLAQLQQARQANQLEVERYRQLHLEASHQAQQLDQRRCEHAKGLDALVHGLALAHTSSAETFSLYRQALQKQEQHERSEREKEILQQQIEGYYARLYQARHTQNLAAMAHLIAEVSSASS